MTPELERLKTRLDKMFAEGMSDIRFDLKPGVPAEVMAGEINRMLDAAEGEGVYQIDFGDSSKDSRYKDVKWKPGERSRMIDGVLVYRSYGDYVDD